MRFSAAAALCAGMLTFVSPQVQAEGTDMYVQSDVLEERAEPGGEVVNRIYKGQKVTVYDEQDGWALVTAPGFAPRWVDASQLDPEKPTIESTSSVAPADLKNDPRIEAEALPTEADPPLTETDIAMIWAAAREALDSGKCSEIQYGDKSTSKADTYYIMCGGQNHFYAAADLKP